MSNQNPQNKFKKGNKIAAGIPRPNAGRPPDWFVHQCKEALEKSKALEFMRGVAEGKEFPQLATSDGEVLPLPPSIKDRQRAIEWLADRGYGKPRQSVEVTGDMTVNLIDAIRLAREARGLR